jgi:hypothetical protein
MGLFKDKDDDSDADHGSGDGGPLGTPGTDAEEPAGGTQQGMVVSGGGVADPSADEGGPTSDE